MKSLLVLFVLLLVCRAAGAREFKLENGFFSLGGRNGVIDSLRFDPTGKAHHGRNHIISLSAGLPVDNERAQPEIDGSRLVIRGAKAGLPLKIELTEPDRADLLQPGHTLGQTLAVEDGVMTSAAAFVPTWTTSDSAVTITLCRISGDKREKIAARRVENLQDSTWVELTFHEQGPGDYLLELSDVKGTAGWWSLGKDAIPGEATADGKPQPDLDRAILCRGLRTVPGEFEVALDGSRLKTKFTPADGSAAPDSLQTRIVMPWAKSGYDTTSDQIVFVHFVTSGGLHMPVHQFKRRPWSNVSGEWVLMSGRSGSDLVFANANIRLEFEEDRMTMVFPPGEREIELRPHTDKLPDHFPVFFSSRPDVDKVLNEFLLSHNFNFGVGTLPDWKDWHTLQMSWTANPQCEWHHRQFPDATMDPDGYVHCWPGGGWPFPYKDDDKDGRNDYDTRHFTTNPCYIIGAWREYCWTREPGYLAKLMPKVRLAMEFVINEMDGRSGMLTARAPGHEGKDGSIGSNYWDILPFGFKDAFTNAHYYPCLEAMAQLEEAALRSGEGEAPAELAPAPRTPYFYRRLAEKARKAFNETFWLADRGRYAACVDSDSVVHDYGHTFVNLPAMAFGLADANQVKRIYRWMETEPTSSGKADTYTRWVFAPRASTTHNPMRSEPQTPTPSWWCMAWNGTPYDGQCQDGGAILYTSFHDILARARFLGADNGWKRLTEILDRYSKPDHLSGGSPLYFGEVTQGGPGGTAGSVGVEGEFPESGLVPVSFLYAFLGIDVDIRGLRIRPNLPSALEYGGVRNLRYGGKMYDIRVTNSSVEMKCTSPGCKRVIRKSLAPAEVFRFTE